MGICYSFEHRWALPGTVGAAYDVLADVERYPTWWREVRAVVKLGEDHALVVCRSVVPKSLYLEMRPVVRDRGGGVLEVSLEGDLDGWSRFTLADSPTGVDVHHVQEVSTHGWFMNAAGRVARPLLVANHDLMMRSARRGLERQLSG